MAGPSAARLACFVLVWLFDGLFDALRLTLPLFLSLFVATAQPRRTSG
jgi:hypothetical protein